MTWPFILSCSYIIFLLQKGKNEIKENRRIWRVSQTIIKLKICTLFVGENDIVSHKSLLFLLNQSYKLKSGFLSTKLIFAPLHM